MDQYVNRKKQKSQLEMSKIAVLLQAGNETRGKDNAENIDNEAILKVMNQRAEQKTNINMDRYEKM